MKFSIIIAAYNLSGLVCKAIESCINQTGVDDSQYEIIVINDGSTDDTIYHINKYANVDNIKIVTKDNAGLSHTRNLGIELAQGEYLLFLDGDDWYSSDALSTLLPYVGKYDIVAFPMTYYYSAKEQKVRLHGLKEGEYGKNQFISATLGTLQFNIIPSPKKMYRKSFIYKNNIRFQEGILHEDNPFFLDIMDACDNVFFINKSIYFYLQNREGSITSCATIRNYNGVLEGINHIEKKQISKNPDVCLLNGSMLVFQALGNYNNKIDRNKVYQNLRLWTIKKRILNYLIKGSFHIKPAIRLILLLIDPSLLYWVVKRI